MQIVSALPPSSRVANDLADLAVTVEGAASVEVIIDAKSNSIELMVNGVILAKVVKSADLACKVVNWVEVGSAVDMGEIMKMAVEARITADRAMRKAARKV